jgi:threonine aldolase
MIDLISDTVTRPSPAMLEAMFNAEVGDDVFKADPTVNALEAKAAKMLGHEDALFCPSGTMTNQIAIKSHTQPMDELICDHYSHVYQYENGGYAYHSGLSIQLIQGDSGKIRPDQIAPMMRPDYDWLPNSRLVVIENSCNKGGGSFYTGDEMAALSAECKKHNLIFHLDGARLFNVIAETGDDPATIGPLFDSISICLSKGLGAPVGSLLIGSRGFIKKARKIRKAMGGGMRQAGYLAAAGIFALDNNIKRLKEDNVRAKRIGKILEGLPWVTGLRPVYTNIVIFDIDEELDVDDIVARMKTAGINSHGFGPKSIRFVTHMHISDHDVDEVERILTSLV